MTLRIMGTSSPFGRQLRRPCAGPIGRRRQRHEGFHQHNCLADVAVALDDLGVRVNLISRCRAGWQLGDDCGAVLSKNRLPRSRRRAHRFA